MNSPLSPAASLPRRLSDRSSDFGQVPGLSVLAEKGCCCGSPAATDTGFGWHAAAGTNPLLARPPRCRRGPKAAGVAHTDSLTADAYL
jgi:hypothetical protein